VREKARTLAAAAAICVAVGGCGGDTVAVHGSVQREGSVVPSGRIVFTPIGGGKPAFGAIHPDGTFRLTTKKPDDGAMIGTYRVMIVGDRSKNKETRTTYVGPRDKPLEVAAGQENEFVINIRAADGWQTVQDD
jgi:hypothetical protein